MLMLIHCRAGFEAEAAAEMMAVAAAQGIYGHVQTQAQQAYVKFVPADARQTEALWPRLDWRRLIFARQHAWMLAECADLPEQDRITPLLQALEARRELWQQADDVLVEHADSEAGRPLSGFCRKFTVPLRQALKKRGWLQAGAAHRLHVFCLNSRHVFLGFSRSEQSSPQPMGIPRLKFPSAAPSRSTLKLEEALHAFIPAAERPQRLREGMSAVDLGACPGGWTYQLLRRGLFVFAVDHGQMAESLRHHPLLEHRPEDGFSFRPPPQHPIQWLVCDMVERPQRVLDLMLQWLLQKRCQEAIFNLKLPMKKRFQEVTQLLQKLDEALQASPERFQWQAKHLYHDREEITVHVRRLPR